MALKVDEIAPLHYELTKESEISVVIDADRLDVNDRLVHLQLLQSPLASDLCLIEDSSVSVSVFVCVCVCVYGNK